MICRDIWEQHKETHRAAGHELRFLRYKDYCRISEQAGITAQDMAFIGRLKLKRKAEAEAITPPEEAREREILGKWPVMDTYAACVVQPHMADGRQLESWLYTLPSDDRETLLMWLEKLTESNPQGVYGLEDLPLIGAIGLQVSKDLDYQNITLQQAMLLLGTYAAALEASRQQAATPGGR